MPMPQHFQQVVKSPIIIHGSADDHAIKDSFMLDNIIEAESNVIRSLRSCITSVKTVDGWK